MRLVIDENRVFTLHFYWDRTPNRERCTATIHEGKCATDPETRNCASAFIGVGIVRRFVKDVFNKKIARRAALTQALAVSGLPRATRRLIWDRYFQISRVPAARGSH